MTGENPTKGLLGSAPQGRQPQQQRSRASLQRIEKALRDMLEDQYFENISMQALAKRAGVSVGSCYQRLGSKQGMLEFVYRSYDSELSEIISRHQEIDYWAGLSSGQIVSRMTDDLWRFYQTRSGLLRTIFLWLRLHPEAVDPAVRVRRRLQMKTSAQAMMAALGIDSDPEPVSRAVAQLSLLLVDLTLFSQLPPQWLKNDEIADSIEIAKAPLVALLTPSASQS